MPPQRRYGLFHVTIYHLVLGWSCVLSDSYLSKDGGYIINCDVIVVFSQFEKDVLEVDVVVANTLNSYCRNSLLAF